jgi:hypothetical protein
LCANNSKVVKSMKNICQIEFFHSWALLPCYLGSELNIVCPFIAKATFHLSLGLALFAPWVFSPTRCQIFYWTLNIAYWRTEETKKMSNFVAFYSMLSHIHRIANLSTTLITLSND